jgi:hypothetical protein
MGASVDRGRIERAFRHPAIVDRAIARATREAVIAHKRAGNPIATWRDGKVVWIQPKDIKV